MKRNNISSSSSNKKTKVTLPDISNFTEISRGVFEGIFEGKPAVVKKNVNSSYHEYYELWKSTKALPQVYATWSEKETGGNVVVMEKLLPFVYKKELEPVYFAAVEEVHRLSKFDNMDIHPGNIMMRADGQVVFIDAWTGGLTSGYWVPRKKDAYGKGNDPSTGIQKSLGRTLFYFEHREKIEAMHETKLLELKAILPTKQRLRLITSQDDRIYNNIEKKCLYTLTLIETSLAKAKAAQGFVEKLGKKIEDYCMLSLDVSTIPELDKFLDTVVYVTRANLPNLAREIGATDDQIKYFE